MAFFYSSYKTAVLGDPSNIIPVYAALGAQFKAALGPVFSSECEEHYRLMFCGLFANDSKPYGQSVAYTMEELCAAPVLDCDNYLMFTWRLFDILCPPAGRLTKVAAWGMDKGFIGNHAMLWAQHPAGYRLLADPTVALFQIGSGFGYDHVASGKPVPDDYRKLMHQRAGEVPEVDAGAQKVMLALREGKCRPSDLLYWYHDIVQYSGDHGYPGIYWHTPAGAA